MSERDDGFLARWSRRKALVREGAAVPEEPPRAMPAAAPAEAPPAPASITARTPPAEPPPSLEEVATLTPASDFGRFVARDVTPEVRNAALKKLFADPRYNLMDGLDTYIDDYGRPDPLPASALRQMAQARFLGLLTEDEAAAETPPSVPALPPADEDADLRLQPDDAAGPGGDTPGPGGQPGRED